MTRSGRGDDSVVDIYAPPINLVLAMLGFFMALCAAGRGAHNLVRGLRQTDYPAGALRVVRGIRGVIVAVSLAALSGGVLWTNKGLLVSGAIFLGEELYETGVVLLALREQLKASKTPRELPQGASYRAR
jgi:hypothetical protein